MGSLMIGVWLTAEHEEHRQLKAAWGLLIVALVNGGSWHAKELAM